MISKMEVIGNMLVEKSKRNASENQEIQKLLKLPTQRIPTTNINSMKKIAHLLVELGIVDKLKPVIRKQYPVDRETLFITTTTGNSLIVHVIKTVNVTFDLRAPQSYLSMIGHLEMPKAPIYRLGTIYNIKNGEDAIEITLNYKNVFAYYLIDKNSLIVGDWTWHEQYLSVIVRRVWPQLVEKLNL